MTFSIAGTDGHGRFGMAVSSSSPAVAARCIHLRDGVGAVSSQNITDPRLGRALLDRLEAGDNAAQALEAVVATAPDIDFRQLVVLDSTGASAVYHGSRTLGIFGAGSGAASVSAGNMLANPDVLQGACDAFEAAEGELEVRLLAGLRGAIAAGGEAGPVYSAGLSVVSGHGWRDTDLRVDWHEDPVTELGRILELWMPQRDAYVTRGLEPQLSEGYGVPGDDR
ncbi:DUF1028 domain-containing protein [Paeniglutamicibacter cryotolerans]|uniref:Putative Ntn-hydrolase superfamily protein n=1 Tax=Paeniglutamicibacter cryotolerans TaxID=670079 RepID=A0A839QUF4_9MICC|nr:DUF1028 domain-containing protein [Paeniglutamicibacter cryotolerans]MBB2995651.1 putative Ntn-hydrolase superfamily protein [Paeniglutamicibacter cryotolerans]